MEPITRLWGVLDYGLVALSREEADNANKDIVQAIEDIDTLKAQNKLYKDALKVVIKHAYKGTVLRTAHQALSKAKELK